MRRKWLLLMFLVVVVVYVGMAVYLLSVVETLKSKVDTIVDDRGISSDENDLVHQLLKPDCRCEDSDEGDHHEVSNEIITLHAADMPKAVCRLIDHQKDTADLNVLDIYQGLQLHYNHYTYTHRGWMSNFLHLSYFSSQWDHEPLEVVIVPISHQDPGWINTADSYYKSKTKGTLNVAVNQLTEDPKMSFMWSEIIYLKKWYEESTPDQKAQLKKLLESGRFQVATGGWVMTDEAVAHYSAMLDQLIVGHQWLWDTFNYKVTHAWSLDPFGVSPTMPYLLQKSGVEDLFIQRVHYNMKRELGDKKQLEFWWRQTWDPGSTSDMLTHLAPFQLYNVRYNCGPDPEICCDFDFFHDSCFKTGWKYRAAETITKENINEKALVLLDQLRKKAQVFQHNQLLMLYGDDFTFKNEAQWKKFKDNIGSLIDYMNDQPDMHIKIKIGTLGDYFEAMKSAVKSQNKQLPSVSGDFLFYNDRDDQYWTGYYTSRPQLKFLTRRLQHKLRAAEILFSLTVASYNKYHGNNIQKYLDGCFDKLNVARETLGLLHHHDAITGTATKTLVDDCSKRLISAITATNIVSSQSASLLTWYTMKSSEEPNLDLLQNMDVIDVNFKSLTQSAIAKSKTFVSVFNPLTFAREEFVTITTAFPFVKVISADGLHKIPCQVLPKWLTGIKTSYHKYQVMFKVMVSPLSLTKFLVEEVVMESEEHCSLSKLSIISKVHRHDISSEFEVRWKGIEDFYLESPLLSASFCGCTGLLKGVLTKDNKLYHKTEASFVKYSTGSFINPLEDKSGAYLFMPNGPARTLLPVKSEVVIIQGPLVNEVRTSLPFVTHKMSLFNTTGPRGAALFIENIVDISKKNNTEVALRFHTDIKSRNIFHTDVNGFQMQKRLWLGKYKIQGNFYPVTTQMYIEDALFRATLHTTSSHGATSLAEGQLEVMLDRRLKQHDWRGLSQGILDNIPTTSHLVFVLETRYKPVSFQSSSKQVSYPSPHSHQVSLLVNHPVEMFLQQTDTDLTGTTYSPISKSLPCDIHLVSLRALRERHSQISKSLLILHRVGLDCDFLTVYSDCAVSEGQVNIAEFFSDMEIAEMEETGLTGLPKASPQTNTQVVNIPWMELKTFKIKLH